jgi:hypothetical protein
MSDHNTSETLLLQQKDTNFIHNINKNDVERLNDENDQINKDEANKLFVLIDQLNNQHNTNYNTDTSSSIYSNTNSIQSSTNNSKTTFNDQTDNINGSFSLLKINENTNNHNEDNSLNLSNDSMLSSPSLSTNDDKNFIMSNEQDSTTTTITTNTIIANNNLTPENGNFSVNELNRRLNGLANNNSNSSNETTKIPKFNGNGTTTITRIPRIPNLKSSNAFPAQPEVVAPTTLGLTSKSRSTAISPSRSTATVETSNKNQTTSNLVRPTKIATNRVTRSSSKSSCVNGSDNNTTSNKLNNVKTNVDSLNTTQQVQHQLPKRGLSSCSVNKSVRSLSVSSPNDDSFNESDFNIDGTKTVRYVVRHKPKESQVKIFSEKVKIKNVSSKIGSFDKANHVPGGGNVQVNIILIFFFGI